MLLGRIRAGLVLALLAIVGCASAEHGSVRSAASETGRGHRPANFVEVRPGLYRGGHPDGAGLDYLKSLGVTRIVNLEISNLIEAMPWDISEEVSEANARGLTEIRYPMSAFETAASGSFDQSMRELTALLKTASLADPIYVHCKHGKDRTGLVIGLERVLVESWPPRKAHDEMLQLGFHPMFRGLERYFEKKTRGFGRAPRPWPRTAQFAVE